MSKTATTKYSVGDKIKVKPGREHDGMGRGEVGIIQKISTPALGIKFPSMSLHKWYADEEVEKQRPYVEADKKAKTRSVHMPMGKRPR